MSALTLKIGHLTLKDLRITEIRSRKPLNGHLDLPLAEGKLPGFVKLLIVDEREELELEGYFTEREGVAPAKIALEESHEPARNQVSRRF